MTNHRLHGLSHGLHGLMITLCVLCVSVANSSYAEEQNQVTIDSELSIINLNQPNEIIMISGKTNLPKDTMLKISLEGMNYYRLGVRSEIFYLAKAIIDGKGNWSAKIPRQEEPYASEAYQIVLSVEPASITGAVAKELKKNSIDAEALVGKPVSRRVVYLGYSQMVERRMKRGLALNKALKSALSLSEELYSAISGTAKTDWDAKWYKQFKETRQAIESERLLLETMQKLTEVMDETSRIYLNWKYPPVGPNDKPTEPPKELQVKTPITSTALAVALQDLLTSEIVAKTLKDISFWFDLYQTRIPQKSGRANPDTAAMKEWENIKKRSMVCIDKIAEEYGQYIAADVFKSKVADGEMTTELGKKSDTVLALLTELKDLSEAISTCLSNPDDTKVNERLRSLRQAIIKRIDQAQEEIKLVSADGK